MQRNFTTMITGIVLAAIFGLMLFVFQVRTTQKAVVTTFGKYSRTIEDPGAYFRLPWPVQKVYLFDKRLQNFERKFEQNTTRDQRALTIEVFVGWAIADPRVFLSSFNADTNKAEQALGDLVRDTKNSVISQHPFGDLISTNAEELKFDQIESEMLKAIAPRARVNYGIDVRLVGIKQLGLPESITAKVFERMRAERQLLVAKFTSEGESRAKEILAEGQKERAQILDNASAQATVIVGQGIAEAAKSFAIFEKNPALATFLLDLDALERSLKQKSTLILDQQTPPFNMLNMQGLEQQFPTLDKQPANPRP